MNPKKKKKTCPEIILNSSGVANVMVQYKNKEFILLYIFA
jgi:hypothetical protein